MHRRALRLLRCPACRREVTAEPLPSGRAPDGELADGLLRCASGHVFPIVGGIPRMLPDALGEFGGQLEHSVPPSDAGRPDPPTSYDRRTRENFSREWDHHLVGDRTWGMDLDTRVKRYFLDAVRLSPDQLEGKVMLDAGCGNGSQSVAYTELGLEVVAVDLSSGLEHGQRFRHVRPGAQPGRVHFVQGDLQAPPLTPAAFDIVHSAGVLHHTSDTRATFRALSPLVRPGGTFYVWLYKYEPVVTPLVNGLRRVTTRIPGALFARLADVAAVPFQRLCLALDALGIRSYPRLSRREAALALMDIFGAPYAHYHSFPEVAEWFRAEGFDEVWPCNDSRRGFGVCGRRQAATPQPTAAVEQTASARTGVT